MEPNKVLGVVILGTVMAIAGSVMLAVYMVVTRLNNESLAILTGMVIMALAMGAIIMPFVYLQIRSRQADQKEFMAMVGKGNYQAPSLPPINITPGLPQGQEGFAGRTGSFVLPAERDWNN